MAEREHIEDGTGGASGISRTAHPQDESAIHMDSPDDETDRGIASADPTGAADKPGSSADAGHSGGVGATGQHRGAHVSKP
jgi:hypothetical protein